MVSRSKLDQQRWQIKWYLSGAVRWQLEIPDGSRIISIARHYFANKAFQEVFVCKATIYTRSSGERDINWDGDVKCFVIPAHERYVFGALIQKIPGNAIPVDVFFGKD